MESRHPPANDLIDVLNRSCHCITVDAGRLRETLETRLGSAPPGLDETHPTLLARSPVFLSRSDVEEMIRVVRAVESVVATPSYRAQALSSAPPVAREGRGPLGVFFGYDFHLSPDGPRLIEINTNAGGVLLNAHLADAQRGCCAEVDALRGSGVGLADLEETIVEMFRNEWRLQRPTGPLRSIVIVDDDPPSQFLHPEFLLFRGLFERHGLQARIADPRELEAREDGLRLGDLEVDLVYNRLTDFYLEAAEHVALRRAYLEGTAVFTPDPHAHALYANKRGLTFLSDPRLLRGWGIDADVVRTLEIGVPSSVVVTSENAESLWSRRRELFFKPLCGHGSRGAYRGAKLTRRVWESILQGEYVAQEMVPPSERLLPADGAPRALKVDIRCYVYGSEVQLLSARMYQGQTTNLRTEGGGLASVVIAPVGIDPSRRSTERAEPAGH